MEYRIIYRDFKDGSDRVAARKTPNFSDKLNHSFRYYDKIIVTKILNDWVVTNIKIPSQKIGGLILPPGEMSVYIPLKLNGIQTCLPEHEFIQQEQNKINNLQEICFLKKELEDEKNVNEILKKQNEEQKYINENLLKENELLKNQLELLKQKDIEDINTIKKTYKKRIPKQIKILSWNIHIGENKTNGKCFCCKKTDIKITNFHAGHYISEKNGGDTNIENIRPICSGCNLSMGSKNMNDFMKEYL